MYVFFVVWSFYFLIKYANSGSMVAYSKTVDVLLPVEKRTNINKLIIKLRPMMQEFFTELISGKGKLSIVFILVDIVLIVILFFMPSKPILIKGEQ